MPRSTATLANVIQSTTDYDQFTTLDTNRNVSQVHVNQLKTSIEETGNLTKVTPILVNGRYQVIDGQHRLEAIKQLGLPIYYTVVEGTTIETSRAMNSLHRNWAPADYAKSYAESGNVEYQTYWKLREDFPQFNHSIILTYSYPTITTFKGIGIVFRNGDYAVQDEATTRKMLDQLEEIDARITFNVGRTFAQAVLLMMNLDGYDHKRFLSKLDTLAANVHSFSTVGDSLRNLEDVYNHNLMPANRLRFF